MNRKSPQETLVDFEIEKIRRFASEELEKMSNGPLPICYQIGADLLIVGKYKIHKIDNKCWRIFDTSNYQLFDFFTRKDAIYYCIALHKKRYAVAAEIQSADKLINELEFNATLYRHLYKKATASGDEWKLEVYSSKYTETMLRLDTLKNKLKQNFILSSR